MTFEEFDALQEKMWAQVTHMSTTKGKEYSGTLDRFDNFNRLATRIGVSRNVIWQVYFTKHMDAIETYIKQGKAYSEEPVLGRIVDAITYLAIIRDALIPIIFTLVHNQITYVTA